MADEHETIEQATQQQGKPKRRGRRAPKGTGYYRKRKDRDGFAWDGALKEGGPRISIYAPTQRQLMAKVEQARKAASDGLPVPSEHLTVARYLDDWFESAKRKMRPRSSESFEIIIRLHLKPGLGHLLLGQLDAQQVEAFLDRKLESGLAPQTVAHIRMVLKLALKKALKREMVKSNAAVEADPPPIPRPDIQPLDDAQSSQFLAAVKEERLEALFVLAINLGMRRGEILGLPWRHVDLDKGTLYVGQALQRIAGKLQIVQLKTKKAYRTLTLPQNVVVALRAHKVRQLQERLAVGPAWQGSELVFTTGNGTPYDPRNVLRDHFRILKRAGLPRIRFHDLRHTAATLLLMKGVQPHTVSEMLGHSSVVITLSLYGHVLPSMRDEAARVMESILG
jgi:integrase